MRQRNLQSMHSQLRKWVDLLSYDQSSSWLLLGVASGGLAVIGLWGLYGDLFLSNLVVVGFSVLLIFIWSLFLGFLVERIVTSHDRWQVEAALTYRQLLTEAKPFAGDTQVGSPFIALRLQNQLQDEMVRCRAYGTPLAVVAFRIELPGQAPTHAVFTQANAEVADLLGQHQGTLIGASALGMFEYGFFLPNSDRNAAEKITQFIATKLKRYRCYFGLAIFPDQETEPMTLLRLAMEDSGQLNTQAA